MPIIEGTRTEVEFPVLAGGSLPPESPGDGGAGRDPDNDRGRLMLLIHNARGPGAASLRYLRGHTGFPRTRLWRGVEDLEDAGYVETFRKEPHGPVSRWLHDRKSPNDRVFASTFLALTESGRNSPELEAFIAAREARRGRRGLAGARAAVGKGLRRLTRNLRARAAGK